MTAKKKRKHKPAALQGVQSPKRGRGRPRTHDRKAIMETVCREIAKGRLVTDVALELKIDRATISDWGATEEFRQAYTRAREEQAHTIAEDALNIADGLGGDADDRLEAMVASIRDADDDDKDRLLSALTNAANQRDRLRVDTRKWLASKIAPRHYGDKLDVTSGGGKVSVEALLAGAYRERVGK